MTGGPGPSKRERGADPLRRQGNYRYTWQDRRERAASMARHPSGLSVSDEIREAREAMYDPDADGHNDDPWGD